MPEFDEDRVYASDIKKIVNWYNMLQAKELISKESLKADEAAEAAAADSDNEAPKTEE